jgi:hypothetical protein
MQSFQLNRSSSRSPLRFLLGSLPLILFLLLPAALPAQLTPADYDRALDLQQKYRGLVLHQPDAPQWANDAGNFVYRRTIAGGFEFVAVDAESKTAAPAFDHARLAETLAKSLGQPVKPELLPFSSAHRNGNILEFELGAESNPEHWRCELPAYTCAKQPAPADRPADDEDGGYDSTPRAINGPAAGHLSPDGKWLAFVENYNLALRPAGLHGEEAARQTVPLSQDGSEGDYYAVDTLAWSPDSKHLAAYRVRPGYRRLVHYIESSPADQLQPKSSAMVYPKPGDLLPLLQPVLFQIETKQQLPIHNALFPNPYELTPFAWWNDSRGFTFDYNQRGHQLYRVVEVDAANGNARTLIEETSTTFVNYEPLTRDQFDHGKYFRHDIADGKEILWASERDGWEHLYLFDGHSGALKQQITKGDWVVRAVDRVDEVNRQIYFEASGINPGEDPYYVHGYRIGFDGSGLTPLSPIEADHTLSYSPDGKYYVDTYSRLDLPPVMELHRASDASLFMAVDKADATALKAPGWQPAEPFHAAGRDGKTQIWGVLYRPANFDPAKKYPVVEDIYAGPQGSFVPKSFTTRIQPLTELGFVVAQIDGMGTNNRSRAFHDVAWHNLKDSGFADRILWHQAAAKNIPGTTSRAWASSAPPQAGKTQWPRCSSILSSTRQPWPTPAAMTTAWTRSGGTSSGWAGRWGPGMPTPRTRKMPGDCRASSCLSWARWTKTSTRPQPSKSPTASSRPTRTSICSSFPGAATEPEAATGSASSWISSFAISSTSRRQTGTGSRSRTGKPNRSHENAVEVAQFQSELQRLPPEESFKQAR